MQDRTHLSLPQDTYPVEGVVAKRMVDISTKRMQAQQPTQPPKPK